MVLWHIELSHYNEKARWALDYKGVDEHLVGDRFSVADLTAAALFYPLVFPPEGPMLAGSPASYESFRAPLADRPGYRWVEEMFRRHRQPIPAGEEVAVHGRR